MKAELVDILDPSICAYKPRLQISDFIPKNHLFKIKPVYLPPNYAEFADKISSKVYESPLDSEDNVLEQPHQVADQLTECVPQFSLRNIPKIQRYYDVEGHTRFDEEDMPFIEARELYEQAKDFNIERFEPVPFVSMEILADFRTFLEEILYLCPWDNIKDSKNNEESPWNLKFSNAKLAAELYKKRSELVSYGYSNVKSSEGFSFNIPE